MEDSIPIWKQMTELRIKTDRAISITQNQAVNFALSLHNSLQSLSATSHLTSQNQVKLGEVKVELRKVEDDLVKALAVKTRKEAKRIVISDSISAVKVRLQELKKNLEYNKSRKEEYAAIMSKQLLALATLEEKANQGIQHKEDIQEAIVWYNKVLGLRIEGGHGVKFIFNNINMKDPKKEYSFTILLAHDTYTLLTCDPHMDGTKELIQEMNQTNGLFKFVRTMREKFRASASLGSQAQLFQLDSSTVSVSGPASSVSFDGNESVGKKSRSQGQTEEFSRSPKKGNQGRAGRPPQSASPICSSVKVSEEVSRSPKKVSSGKAGRPPISASPVRRSPRFKVPEASEAHSSSLEKVNPDRAGRSPGSALPIH